MKRHVWTAAEEQLLRWGYADSETGDLATALGLPVQNVYAKAHKMGLRKSPEFALYQRQQAGKHAASLGLGRFKPGNVPWSKGTKGLAGVHENCKRTQFRKGCRSQNWKPVGTTKVDADGYLIIKVCEPFREHNAVVVLGWVPVHRVVWMLARGPIPNGSMVAFRDGMRTTELSQITVERLELRTLEENMARNTFHQYGPEIEKVVQLRGAITRQINRRKA